MSTKLIQKKKEITFEELCPRWTQAINMKWIIPGLDVSHDKCIVGEAHGFHPYYAYGDDEEFCQYCHDISVRMVNLGGGAPVQLFDERDDVYVDHEKLEVYKKSFMKHWNKCHVK